MEQKKYWNSVAEKKEFPEFEYLVYKKIDKK